MEEPLLLLDPVEGLSEEGDTADDIMAPLLSLIGSSGDDVGSGDGDAEDAHDGSYEGGDSVLGGGLEPVELEPAESDDSSVSGDGDAAGSYKGGNDDDADYSTMGDEGGDSVLSGGLEPVELEPAESGDSSVSGDGDAAGDDLTTASFAADSNTAGSYSSYSPASSVSPGAVDPARFNIDSNGNTYMCKCKPQFEGLLANTKRCAAASLAPTPAPTLPPTAHPCDDSETNSCDVKTTVCTPDASAAAPPSSTDAAGVLRRRLSALGRMLYDPASALHDQLSVGLGGSYDIRSEQQVPTMAPTSVPSPSGGYDSSYAVIGTHDELVGEDGSYGSADEAQAPEHWASIFSGGSGYTCSCLRGLVPVATDTSRTTCEPHVINATVTDDKPAILAPCPEGTTRDGNNIHDCVPVTPAPSALPTFAPTAEAEAVEFVTTYKESVEFEIGGYNSASVPKDSVLAAVKLTVTQSEGAIAEGDGPVNEIGTGEVRIGEIVYSDLAGAGFKSVHVSYDLMMTDGDLAKVIGGKYQEYQQKPPDFGVTLSGAIVLDGRMVPAGFAVSELTFHLQAESVETTPVTVQVQPTGGDGGDDGAVRRLRRGR
jgi:hypothetical protein